jgi:hypothetical protein
MALQTLMLLANAARQVASMAKRDFLVSDGGISSSQLTIRTRFISDDASIHPIPLTAHFRRRELPLVAPPEDLPLFEDLLLLGLVSPIVSSLCTYIPGR